VVRSMSAPKWEGGERRSLTGKHAKNQNKNLSFRHFLGMTSGLKSASEEKKTFAYWREKLGPIPEKGEEKHLEVYRGKRCWNLRREKKKVTILLCKVDKQT